MSLDDNSVYYTTDAPVTEAAPVDASGVSDDEINWSDVERVELDDVPYVDAFGTNEFYKLDYVVTQPLEQPYRVAGEWVTMTKPRSALQKAQWSLNNKPWTLNHPAEGDNGEPVVTRVSQIHGFFKDPWYDVEEDNQYVTGYVPVTDTEALDYISENPGVSVGFRNSYTFPDEYDGVVGGDVNVNAVDVFQTDIYYNHVASGPMTRCSLEDGCGPVTDSIGADEAGVARLIAGSDTPADASCDATTKPNTDTMSDCDCGNDTTLTFDDLDSTVGVDTIRANNDAIDEALDEREAQIDSLEDDLEDVKAERDSYEERVDTLTDTVEEFEREKFEEKASELAALTDTYSEEEFLTKYDEDEVTVDTVEDQLAIARDLVDEDADANADTADADAEDETSETTVSVDSADEVDEDSPVGEDGLVDLALTN